MMLVNGVQTDTIPVADRGLQYGDGVWETLAIRAGRVMQLDAHLARLQKGIDALDIHGYQASLLRKEVAQMLALQRPQRAVLKIIVTRGAGGRGYSPKDCKQATRILSLHAFPDYPVKYSTQGIKLTLCKTRLSHSPLLAGFKHLNRLEQVLARAEFSDDFQEGLVRDIQNHVIEATMSNLFVVKSDRQILTPDLSLCGIEGIARSCILGELRKMQLDVEITTISMDDISQSQGLFLSNSVIQIWPVKQFQNQYYEIPAVVKELQKRMKGML